MSCGAEGGAEGGADVVELEDCGGARGVPSPSSSKANGSRQTI